MTVFIGDVHGKYSRYRKILKECKDSIQVGDMGVGFRDSNGKPQQNPPFDLMVNGNHRFIRGNHDNLSACKSHFQWIPDGTTIGSALFIGGAVSVDKEYRIPDYSWWPDEELDAKSLNKLVQLYLEQKPKVMVTHECPEEIAILLCALSRRQKLDFPSRTREAFQRMWSGHSPKIWIFGHWHFSYDAVINGTRFICLNELEAKEIEV